LDEGPLNGNNSTQYNRKRGRLKTSNVESREMNDLKRDDDITCLVNKCGCTALSTLSICDYIMSMLRPRVKRVARTKFDIYVLKILIGILQDLIKACTHKSRRLYY